MLRLLVKDVLIGPEKITIRHRIPVREPAASGGSHHDTTDTEGDMRNSYLLRWGRGDSTAGQSQLAGEAEGSRNAGTRGTAGAALTMTGRVGIIRRPGSG